MRRVLQVSTRIGWLRAAVSAKTASLDRELDRRRRRSGDDAECGLNRGSGGTGGWRHVDRPPANMYPSAPTNSNARNPRPRAQELSKNPRSSSKTAEIYVKRGVDRDLARQVAGQLIAKDALGAHARDGLDFGSTTARHTSRPGIGRVVRFGAAMPLLMVIVSPTSVHSFSSCPLRRSAFLGLLGAIGDK